MSRLTCDWHLCLSLQYIGARSSHPQVLVCGCRHMFSVLRQNTKTMRIGVVIDSIDAALEAIKGGAEIIIVCQGLLQAGGGLSPSFGLVQTLARLIDVAIYVLVRPSVDIFVLQHFEKQVVLSDVKTFTSLDNVAGVMIGAQTRETREVDQQFAREIVANANGKQVWYHRAYMCLSSEMEGFAQMKQCGLTGVVIALHGEVPEDKVQYAADRLEALENLGLQAMLSGAIDKQCRPYVVKCLSRFLESKTLHSWIVTVPVESAFEGALLPWRDWDVAGYIWPDVKTQRIRIGDVSSMISLYASLETTETSSNSTVAVSSNS
eukprot:Gregarina_sp_Poly_1__813@NODE_1194_length_4814_cov_24_634506_g166_i3_p2_GENE_NODE_1194_length_4814_cov_24_634506_g166_i3NODE_1194_length_4814_cov_24_634506_g166_i3_p2_ORF_typecomplete_len320_score32_97CutC/PF03932_14/1_7e24_NODE_1194_length_4814_cov_24_634506_g166_i324753434